VLHAAIPGTKQPERKSLFRKSTKPKKNGKDGGSAIEIKGLIPGMAVHFAGCCHPLPGERIVGIVTTGKGVTIHTIDCDILSDFQDQPERWLDVSWSADAEAHIGRLYVVVANEPGTLGDITTVIGRNEGNISNLKFTSRHADFFEMMIDVEVDNVRHLTNIIAALRATPVVSSVQRAKG
jgi:GTP pyrophosphokinase